MIRSDFRWRRVLPILITSLTFSLLTAPRPAPACAQGVNQKTDAMLADLIAGNERNAAAITTASGEARVRFERSMSQAAQADKKFARLNSRVEVRTVRWWSAGVNHRCSSILTTGRSGVGAIFFSKTVHVRERVARLN
jgi:hypothetical protein